MIFGGMTLPAYRAGDNTFAGRPLADVVRSLGHGAARPRRRAGSRERDRRPGGRRLLRRARRRAAHREGLGDRRTHVVGFLRRQRARAAVRRDAQARHRRSAAAPGTSVHGRAQRPEGRQRASGPASSGAPQERQAHRLRADGSSFEPKEVKVALSHREPRRPRGPARRHDRRAGRSRGRRRPPRARRTAARRQDR